MSAKNVPLKLTIVAVLLVQIFHGATTAQETDRRPVVVTFQVKDLPVWRVDASGKPHFDASILISHIKNNVEPESWKSDSTSINQDPANSFLIVLQTPEIIDKVSQFIGRQRAFADHDVKQRLNKNLEIAAIASQRVLLFVSDASSRATDDFFNARFGDKSSKVLDGALSNFIIQCMTPAQARQLADVKLRLPAGSDASIVLLNADGALVANATLNQFRAIDSLDTSLLSSFLNEHSERFPDAEQSLQVALERASQESKNVLVQMGGPNCGPCIRLTRYLDSYMELISKDYVSVKLVRMTGADDLTSEYVDGLQVIPWMAVLSSKGEVLATSVGEPGNIGFPQSGAAKLHFTKMLESSSRRLTADEIGSLINGLTEQE